jgi:signal peptidase I
VDHPVTDPGDEPGEGVTVEAPRKRSRALDAVVEIVTTIVLAVVLYVVIQTFVVQTYRVEMNSMEPTLLPNQHLLIDKLTPRFDPYSRGDIVVFHPPVTQRGDIATTCANGKYADDETPFIKRVIGVPGDTVEVKAGSVWVNNVKLSEPYIDTDGNTEPLTDITQWTVPDGCLFVLGDHRTKSQDSREFGMVKSSEVIGRAWLRFWPINTLGVLQTPTYPELNGK